MNEKKRTPAVEPSAAPALSAITERIVTMLREKDAAGVAEYHDTVDRTDFTAAQWLDHLLSELLDASKYLEAMRGSIIRGDQAASLLAGIGWAWNGDLWQPPAEEAASQSAPTAAQEAVAWVKTKPTTEGDYYVRGFNLFAPKQYEALVQVRMHHFNGELAPELVCNLHESTSSEDMDDWSPIVEMSDDFEWRGPLFAAPVAASPGTDLEQFREAVLTWSDAAFLHHPSENPQFKGVLRAAEADRLLALIDASPKGGIEAQPMFYIQDTRSFVGNCVVWWAPDGKGYVTRLDEAGRYTEEEAIRQNRTRDTDVPWPCDEIDKLARPTVDFQHMRPRSVRLVELAAQAGDAEVQP